MIQIYAPDNTNFDLNGDMVLLPSRCDVQAELGGMWALEMNHPIDDEGRWKHIVQEAVVSVPTFMGKKQLYRIDEADKQDTEISVKAYPIFFDSADEVFLMDKRPTAKNGQEALEIMTEGTKYSGESNIKTTNTAYFVRRNLVNAINGDNPSFIGIWGGEPLYDNFKIIINERAGGDYGAEVRYGKNMDGISFKTDMSEVVTRIVPVAFNGRTLSSDYVDSPLISKYAKTYIREIVFEDIKFHEDVSDHEDTSNIIVCNSQEELDAALIQKCNEQFEAGIDLYKVTIDIDVISLENTEEYKDFKDIVKIGLGDTVSCHNKRLGISTKARAIKITWDCIEDCVKNVTIGDYEHNVFDDWNNSAEKIENIVNKDGSVIAEKVQGILNGMKTQLKIQSTAAQKQEARAILFEDLDTESPLYGAMALGTQGLQISNKRTADGRDWEWSTAFTAKGGYADAIITGLLSDSVGRNYWNLDTGEFAMSASAKVGDSTVASQQNVADAKDAAYLYTNEAVNELDNALAMQEIFNRLTNNGQIQGLFMKDGQLYVNAAYILTGILTDNKGNNFWNLETGEFSMSAAAKVGNSTVASTQNVADAKDSAYLYADNAVEELDNSLVMQEIFNRLTNNGEIQGLFMKDGQLYINASYIMTGILDASKVTVEGLEVGTNVTMGENATISWGNVTEHPKIPSDTNDLTNGAGYQNASQVTNITKNTVTTEFVNALKVKAGSVDAENITGKKITGKEISGGSIELFGDENTTTVLKITKTTGEYWLISPGVIRYYDKNGNILVNLFPTIGIFTIQSSNGQDYANVSTAGINTSGSIRADRLTLGTTGTYNKQLYCVGDAEITGETVLNSLLVKHNVRNSYYKPALMEDGHTVLFSWMDHSRLGVYVDATFVGYIPLSSS